MAVECGNGCKSSAIQNHIRQRRSGQWQSMLLLTAALLAVRAGAKNFIVETEDSGKKEQETKRDYIDDKLTQPGNGYKKAPPPLDP